MHIWMWALILGVGGVAASAFFYWYCKNKKFASRVLDLASYSLTAAGFVSLFIALGNYEARSLLETEKTALATRGNALIGSVSAEIKNSCGKLALPLLYMLSCESLLTYEQTLHSVDVSGPNIIPNFPVQDNLISAALKELPNEISRYNGTVADFRKRSLEVLSDKSQYWIIQGMILVFSLSFTVGISRRFYDALVDRRAK